MEIQAHKLGNVTFDEKNIIIFDKGLFGFEHLKKYVLVDSKKDSLFKYLQSIEDPSIMFIVANPLEVVNNYELVVDREDVEELNCVDYKDLITMVIITIPDNVEELSANLLGPVLIASDTQKGAQVVSKCEHHTTKHFILRELRKEKVS